MEAVGIVDSLNREIKALESLRGFILWHRAPVALADAVQFALDKLNEAVTIAEIWIEKNRENLIMKDFIELLAAFTASKEAVQGARERVDQLGAVCATFNAGFDQFKACAEGVNGLFVCPEEEAAPNGELSDGGATESTGDGVQAEGVV